MKILKEIQEWDKQIYTLEEEKNTIPEQIEAINCFIVEQKNVLTNLQDELKKLQLKQKGKEVELAGKEENVRKYDAQLSQVKTNKEYKSLQDEIASLKADNSLLEEQIIQFMDDVQAVQKKLEEQKKKFQTTEIEQHQKVKTFEEKAKAIEGQSEVLTKQRNEKIKQVDPEIASVYDRIVVKKRGVALVEVTGEVCNECQMTIRPQIINEIKMKEKVVFCENCSRILYCE
ncbi:MAG: hypothetical protein A3G33_11500 [Omnitrophica bacterium RIFCSPLOWO2_12_FULL_44_17]|uniref:Uncharacterized protein n=1 Tax=Candidatus Danuiimicrobium aquiferis TaxID=1801832 RepID=A0A1G1KRN1_9BACT|nr:MAG: hypothetical protein A3B72_09340 [Omnitrophica bacterium RIFCSPHIGHO2_02_FULL_45_28]OGW91213.1 MAG: hypothetical protein A3E74_02870 [Omnitrophica bacterium RIFCSPHIGHO2_12_FULL_44_12]OGW95614.1 MAG: hypothetical protein A3G33_11500 [Omnitrophica bacterium RIFCSPLOWO2_12_FULL_44_17]